MNYDAIENDCAAMANSIPMHNLYFGLKEHHITLCSNLKIATHIDWEPYATANWADGIKAAFIT